MQSDSKSSDYLERGLARIRSELHAHDLRLSQTRDALVRCVLQQPSTFCIKDIVQELLSIGLEGAHFATVYRAMPLLVNAGIVRAMRVSPADPQRFEVTFEREPQSQLRCSSCGTSTAFRSRPLEALRSKIAEDFGFELENDAVDLRGRCRLCATTPRD